MVGIVHKSGKKIFECELVDSKKTIQATALGEVLKKDHPVVGDRVELKEEGAAFEIHNVLERENEVYRRIVRINKKKVIASNVDVLLIVTSLSRPLYKRYLLDRYLLRAIEWQIPAAIVFNKMDEYTLLSENENSDFEVLDLKFEKSRFESLGVKTFFVASSGTKGYELKRLKEYIKSKTAITLGQSGVGKSKLITALSEGKVELLSTELAKKVLKGSHTTTWAQMVKCGDFNIVDSPGVRSLSLQDFNQDELHLYFPDLIDVMSECKFKDCRHDSQSKGCAFHLLDETLLKNQIILDRLTSFKRIRKEVESLPEWKKNN